MTLNRSKLFRIYVHLHSARGEDDVDTANHAVRQRDESLTSRNISTVFEPDNAL